jgi:uncharacterized membrane protein
MNKTLKSISVVTFMVFFINIMIPFFTSYVPVKSNTQTVQTALKNNTQTVTQPVVKQRVLYCHGKEIKYGYNDTSENTDGKNKKTPYKKPDYTCPSCYVSAHGVKNMVSMMEYPSFYHQYVVAYIYNAPEILKIKYFSPAYAFHNQAPPVA